MEEFPCKVWSKIEDSEQEATIQLDCNNGCQVVIATVNGSRWSAHAGDPLSSLNLIREQMESKGLFPLCCGARLDVAASGMARGARATRKVYRLIFGKQALREDLVDIFDPTEKNSVATLQEQREFYQKWVDSLG